MAFLKSEPVNFKLTRQVVRANIPALVDELGRRKAILAEAKAAVDVLTDALKEISPSAETLRAEERNVSYEGELFEAVVYAQAKSTTDWEAVCRAAKVPARIIKKFTTLGEPTLACRVQARKMPA